MEELDLGWQIIEGKKPILIVAGHNFNQGRKGKIKWADIGTGDIARKICEENNFWGIISTRDQIDPNWYTDSPFREKVKELIKTNKIEMILDIHGRKLGSSELIELIGNNCFIKKYSKKLNEWKINNCVDDEQITLAEELDETLPVLVLEIREDGRIKTIDENKYNESQKLIKVLIENLFDTPENI